MATLLDVGAGRVVPVAVFYKISDLLGIGRYSEVYKAFDTNSQTDVAVKLYSGFDSSAHEMARAEAETLAQIAKLNSEYFPHLRRSARHRLHNRNHPVLILELACYVYTNGQKSVISLKDIIPEPAKPLPAKPDSAFWASESVVHWLIHLFQGVKQLHEMGIIHRDLKPANILIKRAAGQSASVPLFLDFNSAASTESHHSRGTPRYLPPEVVSGKRTAPAECDDLWAVAMIAWEIIHGQGTSPGDGVKPHDHISGSIPNSVLDVFRQALLVSPESRYQSAGELLSVLESAVRSDSQPEGESSATQVAQARGSMERIRLAIWQALAPPGELVVPKEIEVAVTTAIAWLTEEETQSLDLVAELVRLGPLAIPVCLQQGYRLSREKAAYDEIVRAIVQLSSADSTVAARSIDKYALSSNVGVRALCWAVCEALHYFPEIMLDSLKGDEGLLLPDERLKIADLCIRFSTRKSAVLALVKYMCREYILDRNRYRGLCATVARRMHELQLRDESAGSASTPQQSLAVRQLITPLLIAQDTGQCVWRELREFDEIPDSAKEETERGLLELMAEAFAATGNAGLEILRADKVPRNAGPSNLHVYRRFATRLAITNSAALEWLKSQAPGDYDAEKAVEAVLRRAETGREAPERLLAEYLQSGDKKLFNDLRFWRTEAVLQGLDSRLQSAPSSLEVDRSLRLLKGYDSRQRAAVVEVMLTHWSNLSKADYATAVQVLTQFEVPSPFRSRAIDVLNRDLSGPNSPAARKGLELLLR